MPKEYPLYQICHRYFLYYVRKGVMQKMLRALSRYHASGRKRGDVDVVDGSFSSAKKGTIRLAKLSGEGFQDNSYCHKKEPAAIHPSIFGYSL